MSHRASRGQSFRTTTRTTRPSGRRAVVRALLAATFVSAVLGGAACGPSAAAGASPVAATARTATARWSDAYAYLRAQRRPTEIICGWFRLVDGAPVPTRKPLRFYDFSDTAPWRDHLITRFDGWPTGTVEMCEATVPTTVPYGPDIETFLARYGLIFGVDSAHAGGLTPVEIAYAGQSSQDPDIIYRHKPGLFGLRMALWPLEKSAFKPGTSKVIPPTRSATAARYLRYAKPLLDWYGFKG